MSYKNFETWAIQEGKDIFGFERNAEIPQITKTSEEPQQAIETDLIMTRLSKYTLGSKMPMREWQNEVQWGVENGAIKIYLSPLGSLGAYFKRRGFNLLGQETWFCKEVYPFRHLKENAADTLPEELFEIAKRIDLTNPESANGNFEELESLVYALGSEVRRKAPEIFVFEGIRKVSDFNYLIYMSLRGQGVEAPQHARVEEFVINVSYNKSKGILKCFGHDVQSQTKQHTWTLQPSEWEFYFAPTQERDEMIRATINALSIY